MTPHKRPWGYMVVIMGLHGGPACLVGLPVWGLGCLPGDYLVRACLFTWSDSTWGILGANQGKLA